MEAPDQSAERAEVRDIFASKDCAAAIAYELPLSGVDAEQNQRRPSPQKSIIVILTRSLIMPSIVQLRISK